MSITFSAMTADGEWSDVASLNQSNTNALQTMVSLGFDEGLVDYSGSIEADELRALIVLAQATLDVVRRAAQKRIAAEEWKKQRPGESDEAYATRQAREAEQERATAASIVDLSKHTTKDFEAAILACLADQTNWASATGSGYGRGDSIVKSVQAAFGYETYHGAWIENQKFEAKVKRVLANMAKRGDLAKSPRATWKQKGEMGPDGKTYRGSEAGYATPENAARFIESGHAEVARQSRAEMAWGDRQEKIAAWLAEHGIEAVGYGENFDRPTVTLSAADIETLLIKAAE